MCWFTTVVIYINIYLTLQSSELATVTENILKPIL